MGRKALGGSIVVVLIEFFFASFSVAAFGLASQNPIPTAPRLSPRVATDPPVVVIVPTPAAPQSHFSIKDLFIPTGTLLGAGIGMAGALWAASVAASSQERRAREENQIRREDLIRDSRIKDLNLLIEALSNLFQRVVELWPITSAQWQSTEGNLLRQSVQLAATQVLTFSRQSADSPVELIDDYLRTARDLFISRNREEAAPHFTLSATQYDELVETLRGLRDDLV